MFCLSFSLIWMLSLALSNVPTPSVQVYNNVLPKANGVMLSSQLSTFGSQHYLIDRFNNIYDENILPIEQTIIELLNTLDDQSPYIEYWYRKNHINLDAHRDIDEYKAKADSDSDFDFPISGHVLYLDIGESCIGPTCIIEEYENKRFTKPLNGSMVIVPSKTSRLLRFRGTALHSVPRPNLAYLDAELGGTNHEIFMPNAGEDKSYRRAVLLFNTWNHPPMKVQKVDQDNNNNNDNYKISINNDKLTHTKDLWEEESIINSSSPNDQKIRIKVGILGDRKRRENRSFRFIKLQTNDGEEAVRAFKSSSKVYSIPIEEI